MSEGPHEETNMKLAPLLIVFTLAVGLAASPDCLAAEKDKSAPNIVLIMADDK